MVRISPYTVRKQENTDHKNSVFGHFSRSEDVYGSPGYTFGSSRPQVFCEKFFFAVQKMHPILDVFVMIIRKCSE